jgi:superfamily II DNA/RNA helicase
MAGFDKLKLNKQLIRSVAEVGYAAPKEVQLKTLTRIIGGQDLIAIAPEGFGKTTTYILSTLNRFNYAPEGVPKVLILVPEKEDVLAVIEQFELINKNKSIAIVGLYVTPGIEAQMDALADGADIVVATPDRARAIYLKLALNLNKTELMIVDDADRMIKKGMQLPIVELANSIGKCQHLVFTDVMHSRLEKMLAPFMNLAATIEIEALEETPLETHQQLLYNVPNFATKVNLLNLFMYDEEVFTNFDLPGDKETYISRVTSANTNSDDETLALTFATDLELSVIKKIEQATGKKMQPAALPDDLVIVNESKPKAEPTKQSIKSTEPEGGAAFHEKKASNSKNYNFSSGQKAKMNMKKKHG